MPQKKSKKKETKGKQKNETPKKEKAKPSNILIEHFSPEELHQLRNLSKTKDPNNIPVIIAAVILNKIDLLQKLIQNGYSIHETGPNHTTTLMWAVKYKNIPIIEFLLQNGADATIKNGNGDNAIFMASENKLWDEPSFISFWNCVTSATFVDVDFVNKNGRNMLHSAIRRDWKQVVELLIASKIDINHGNHHGVTPLMLASYHNNLAVVNVLLEANADVFKEDIAGNTALCFAISYVVDKNAQKPHMVVEQLIHAHALRQVTFSDFFKSRIEALLSSPLGLKSKRRLPDGSSIISYVLRFHQQPFQLMTNAGLFGKITQAILEKINESDYILKLLGVINEILPVGNDGDFDGIPDACLLVLKTYGLGDSYNHDFILQALTPITFIGLNPDKTAWVTQNYNELLPFYEKLQVYRSLDSAPVFLQKHETFVKLMEGMRANQARPVYEEQIKETPKACRSNAKKTKRRAKALKAKIAKIKSADLTERLNQNGKKILEQKCASDSSIAHKRYEETESMDERTKEWVQCTAWEQIWNLDDTDDGNFNKAITVLQNNLLLSSPSDSFNLKFNMDDDSPLTPDWRALNSDETEMEKGNLNSKATQTDVAEMFNYTLSCLSRMLGKIISLYQNHWMEDKRQLEESYKLELLEGKTRAELEETEHEHVAVLQKAFDSLALTIKTSLEKNLPVCSKVIDRLETLLLQHRIRGKPLLSYYSCMEQNQLEIALPTCLESVLTASTMGAFNNQPSTTNPDSAYIQEIASLPPATINHVRQRTNRIKTMKNAYHLVPSIITMCDDDDELFLQKHEQLTKRESPDGTSKKRQTLQETLSVMPKINDSQKLLEALEGNPSKPEYHFLNLPSRWSTVITNLKLITNHKNLLSGEVRISPQGKETCHIISAGGNFNSVIVGLDSSNLPLAVKRIRKENSVCKIIKNLLNPLLGLRNVNLLHYYTCSYEENELILTTPLCEYNMGEYIMLLKQSPSMVNRSIDIVKQFLAGLRFLHNQTDAIIHGNLKPSNIFIDLNGTVRIAEFGMHKALYLITEAPNTSVIWFSRETFVKFKESSTMECSSASDIQVAGMLVHFVLTGGKHPYGDTMQEIIKNLERALPQLTTNNIDLHDLISWMLLYDPHERPTINQVLSHVFFWTIDRKWRFILACSGISLHGTPLNIPLNELYLYINVKASKENIKGSWINITKTKFPKLSYSQDDHDTITGFLKFIRSCMQNEAALHLNGDYEFRNFILSSFPALPLSLYRILETSQWLSHRILQPFTTVDSVSA